jgi:hypothetical protein
MVLHTLSLLVNWYDLPGITTHPTANENAFKLWDNRKSELILSGTVNFIKRL